MKVLGLINPDSNYQREYIVQVSHSELAAAFEKGYGNELPCLKVGTELNLAFIPEQRQRIEAATRAMSTGYAEFVKAAPVMADLARVLAARAAPTSSPTPEGASA